MQLSPAVVVVAPVSIVMLFATAIIGVDRLGFRDVSHFYTPLYDYVAWRTSSDWLPLWNPLDQTGVPLVGETTTAVFYPVRYVLFALPISTDVAMAWYVALHLILASLTARAAARWAGASLFGATIAGLVYPLSGTVLFLYSNPPFLVGAAWLPLALGVLLAPKGLSPAKRTIVAAGSMSMMILGGDPQSALHAMILGAMIWLGRRLCKKPTGAPGWVLLAAPALAAALAAPQFAASVSWSIQSDRVGHHESQGWTEPPVVASKRHEAFQFSLPPWHVVELATPHAFGSLLPVHRRVSQLIPGDGRMWTPSIYMGMLVLVALLARLSQWRSGGLDAYLVTALVTLALAMGHFGIVWWIQTSTGWLARMDSAVGGPYWWLYQCLPGYDSFRYPAKWLTPFSFAAAIAAATWVDHPTIDLRLSKRLVQSVAIALAVGLVIVLMLWMLPHWIHGPQEELPRDTFWGPLQIGAGLTQIIVSILHSAIVLLAIALLLRRGQTRAEHFNKVKCGLIAIVAVDLVIGGYSLITRVPRSAEQVLLSQMAVERQDVADSRWMRTQSGGGWPADWRDSSDPDRVVMVEASLRAAWFGRWHLADRAAVLNNMVSIRGANMAMFWDASRIVTKNLSSQQTDQFWKAMRRWLAINGVVQTTSDSMLLRSGGQSYQMAEIRSVQQPTLPPLTASWDWERELPTNGSEDDFAERLREIWQSDHGGRPIVQTESPLQPSSGSKQREAVIETIDWQPDHAEYHVRLSAPALVTRPVLQDGAWVCDYAAGGSGQWERKAVHQVDYVKQGVLLPVGDWQVRFRYAPSWLPWSLGVAAVAWLICLGWWTRFVSRRC